MFPLQDVLKQEKYLLDCPSSFSWSNWTTVRQVHMSNDMLSPLHITMQISLYFRVGVTYCELDGDFY